MEEHQISIDGQCFPLPDLGMESWVEFWLFSIGGIWQQQICFGGQLFSVSRLWDLPLCDVSMHQFLPLQSGPVSRGEIPPFMI